MTQDSMLSIEYKLGSPVSKLSMEDTACPSKKNWKVTSFPWLLNQSLIQPCSIKNAFFETSPSRNRIVRAGTSCRLNKCANSSHGIFLSDSRFIYVVSEYK